MCACVQSPRCLYQLIAAAAAAATAASYTGVNYRQSTERSALFKVGVDANARLPHHQTCMSSWHVLRNVGLINASFFCVSG